HDIEGYNGRLDAIQAGFLQVKLRHLDTWNEQRRSVAERYGKLFVGAEDVITLPFQPDWSRSVFHLYVVRVADRAQAQKRLDEAGVNTGIHYPIPLHLCRAYECLGFKEGDFPISERASSQILSLPMFPGLTPQQQNRVVTEVLKALCGGNNDRGIS